MQAKNSKKLSQAQPVAIGNNKVTPKNIVVKVGKKVEAKKPKVVSLFDKIDALLATNYDIETISILSYSHQDQIAVTFNKYQTVGDIITFEEQTNSLFIYFDSIDAGRPVMVFYANPPEQVFNDQAKKYDTALDSFVKTVQVEGVRGSASL